MERIKKFYKKHQSEVNVAAASIAVAFLVTKRKYSGQEVVGVNLWQADNGDQSIMVLMKNGTTQSFDRLAPRAA